MNGREIASTCAASAPTIFSSNISLTFVHSLSDACFFFLLFALLTPRTEEETSTIQTDPVSQRTRTVQIHMLDHDDDSPGWDNEIPASLYYTHTLYSTSFIKSGSQLELVLFTSHTESHTYNIDYYYLELHFGM